jgi:hypothetical protein
MENPMKRFSLIPLIMLSTAAFTLLSACQPTADSPPASSATSAPTTPVVDLQSGIFDLLQPTSGLDRLSSYQASLTLQFQGTEGAQPVQWSRTYVMRAARSGGSFRQMDLETSRTGAAATRRMLAEVNGYQYEKVDQEACAALPADQVTALAEQWEPASLLLGFSGAALAGEETIESLDAVRYTFDQRSLGQTDLTQSAGEVWMAASNGVVLRYTLIQQGSEDYFGEGVAGSLSWTYEVTKINQPQILSLPVDCLQPAVLELPLPADASQVNQSDDFLSFTTALTETELLDFYRPTLEAGGWQPVENLASGDFDLSDFDLSDFDLSDFDLSDFDDSDFNITPYEDDEFEEGLSVGASDPILGSYRFSRGKETLTLIVIPEGKFNSINLFLSTNPETVGE